MRRTVVTTENQGLRGLVQAHKSQWALLGLRGQKRLLGLRGQQSSLGLRGQRLAEQRTRRQKHKGTRQEAEKLQSLVEWRGDAAEATPEEAIGEPAA